MSKAHPPELQRLSPLSEAKECKPSTSSAPDAAAKLMSGLNLEEAVEEPSECVVCCEIRDLVQFIPCGHKIACIDCAIRMKKCLTCEEVIQHKLLKGNTSKSIQSTERKKFYELEIGKLNDEYTAKISSLTERIQQGEKLQEEKDELIKTYNEEKEKLEKTKEEERKIQEGKLEIAKCEITKLIEEKNKIEQEHLAQVEELKQMLENKEKAYEEKISELTEKLEKEKKLETAEVIILGPEAISVTPDPCHEVVVLTSDEPSSSGICTQSTQQKSKAELLEELRQETQETQEAQEKLRRIVEDLELSLSCRICSQVFVKPVKLPCLHTFCQTCILHWERNQRDCPMCRAKYTTVGLEDTLLVRFIEKLIESTYTQDEKLKRAELVAARVEIEKQLLPSTSDSGQTRGSRGRNSGQRAVRTTRGVKRPPWRF